MQPVLPAFAAANPGEHGWHALLLGVFEKVPGWHCVQVPRMIALPGGQMMVALARRVRQAVPSMALAAATEMRLSIDRLL
jgi:hypothetical protein